jgi:predicted dehydrogenase
VSTCDIIPERAEKQAQAFNVPNHFPHIEKMLAGPEFDLMVNLTDMQEHEHLNREAIAANKHIWSEKPIANSLAAGQALLAESRKRGLRLWGAPIVVASPQFAFMAKTLAAGALGRVAAAHADYGHTGPDWSAFFYEKGGGSMPDLGVYNITSLTGLLGPARSVTAMLEHRHPHAQHRRQRRNQSHRRGQRWCYWTTVTASSRTQSGFNSSIPTATTAAKRPGTQSQSAGRRATWASSGMIGSRSA